MAKNEEKLDSSKYWITTTPSNFNQIVKDHLKDKKDFLVYLYGDHDAQGRSWCPDCVIAQPYVDNVLPRIMKNESKKEVYFINISVSIKQRDIYRNDKIIKMKRIPTIAPLAFFQSKTESKVFSNACFKSDKSLGRFSKNGLILRTNNTQPISEINARKPYNKRGK